EVIRSFSRRGKAGEFPSSGCMEEYHEEQTIVVTYLIFFLAVILMFAADRLGLPALRFAAVIVIGVTAVAAGIQIIITRDAFFLPVGRNSLRSRAESCSGLAAQIWGVIFVLFGLSFIGIGV